MNRSVRKWAAVLAAACIVLSAVLSVGITVLAAPRESKEALICEGYCVIDVDTGEVILGKNIDTRYYPASTTKVMTALVTLENVPDLNAVLTYSDWAISSLSWDSSTLQPMAAVGEQMTVRDVLYGMMLMSGNECANALAQYTAGSQEAFAALMNQRAAAVGAVNTNFVNAHGLHDDNHYTTPYDLSLIFMEALKNDTFFTIDSTARYQIPATNMYPVRELSMGHQMIVGNYDYPYAIAGKTGSTPEAGRTLVTYAVKDDMRLVCVIMKSTDEAFYQDTEKLLDEAFEIVKEKHADETEEPDGLYTSTEAADDSEGSESESNSSEENNAGENSSQEIESSAKGEELPSVEVADRSEETSWLFWAVIIAAGLSFLTAVILIGLIIWEMIQSRRGRNRR